MKKKETTRELHLWRKKMWEASIENFKQYLDKNTGLIKKKFLEYRNCPSCGSKKNRKLLNKNGGTYVVCENKKCEMIFINPVFKDKELETHYRNNHSVRSEITLLEKNFLNNIFGKGLNLATKKIEKKGNILEVGCSSGYFLDIAKKKGWKTYGLELNQIEAKISRDKGHVIQEKKIENAIFDTKFDIIFFWDVFEHIKDGIKCLEICKKLLNKNRIVFLQCPSRDSLALKILQKNCNMLDGLEHVNLYGYKSLKNLCDRSSFDLINYETVISEIGVVNNYLDFTDPYLGKTKNTDNLFNLIDENLMHKAKLGYKFQACLKVK